MIDFESLLNGDVVVFVGGRVVGKIMKTEHNGEDAWQYWVLDTPQRGAMYKTLQACKESLELDNVEVTLKAKVMREAFLVLSGSYLEEDDVHQADLVAESVADMTDETMARFYDIMRHVLDSKGLV